MVSQVEVLSDREKELLSNYDSRVFGFLRLQDPICDPSLPNLTHQSLLRKGVRFFEEELQRDSRRVHPTVYCRLGHYHLLLEEFSKALSAYQKFYSLQQVDYWKDAPFLYGLGIVYFNFAAYQWSIKTFQQVLYLDPGFSCSNEVHLRLGIMFKAQCNYEASVKHFHLALLDSNPCSLSKVEIRFHLGHIFEMQNKCQLAEESYDTILEMPNVPNSVKANAYKQLGWMYYNKEHLGDRATRMQKAIQLLQKAIETDANSGSAWYLIGRCYAMQGKVHDAFTSYRHAIDKSEANADTWCSIGVLYQQQNQPMDALQAYVCAIQLDAAHVAAWTDLGILYEACNQPSDAVTCYNYARRYGATDSSIEARVKALQAELASTPSTANKQGNKMPSIEEAWKLPIPAELTTRTIRNAQVRMIQTGQVPSYLNPQQQQQLQQMYLKQQQQQQAQAGSADAQSNGQSVNTSTALSVSGSTETAATSISQPSGAQQPQATATISVSSSQHSQSSTNQYEQHNGIEQQQVGETSAMHGQLSGNHPQSGALTMVSTSLTSSEISSVPVSGISRSFSSESLKPLSINTNQEPSSMETDDQDKTLLNAQPVSELSMNGPSVSVELMEDSSSFNQSSLQLNVSTTSTSQTTDVQVSHDILSGPSSNFNPSSVLTGSSDPTLGSGAVSSNSEVVTVPSAPSSMGVSISPFSSPSYAVSPTPKFSNHSSFSPIATQPLTINPISSCLSPNSNLHGNHLLSPTSLISPNLMQLSPSQSLSLLSPGGNKSLPSSGGQLPIPKISLLLDENAIPTLPKAPSPPLPTDKLSPPTPSIFVENKRDAMSPVLQNLCISPSQPITVIRGLAAALKLDLSLFSTKTLVETNGDHQVEVRTQLNQASDENWDSAGEKKVWVCESSRSYSTIAKYAQYQANTFQESLTNERNKQAGMARDLSQSDSDSSASSKSTVKKGNRKFKLIKFGTNVDLSDERKWKTQLQELTKLPPYCRVVAPGNMLSHVGHIVLGMNSVQLYMKIPGCRTPGHQENINFCSVNINIGPGDCEWFAIPYEYWGVLANMCEKNNVNFLTGSWWPVLEDLYEERVPVYRFIQRPGDMVWINGGVPHWVQALGWCNNIAWNVGPLTEYMYNINVERYEWNKLQSEKSIVGVIHLTWNLARNIRITERRLYEHMRLVLARTLKYCQITSENLRRASIDVIWHGKRNNEPVHYCSSCDIEVFNYLFVTNNKKHLVHCQDCARKTSSVLDGFIVLNQYKLEDLVEVYNSFKLHSHGSEEFRPTNQIRGPNSEPVLQMAS